MTTNIMNEAEGIFGIDCIDDQLVITIIDPNNNTDIQLKFPLDTAIDVCNALIYYTCMIGDGKNILEIIKRIISVDSPIFNTTDAVH